MCETEGAEWGPLRAVAGACGASRVMPSKDKKDPPPPPLVDRGLVPIPPPLSKRRKSTELTRSLRLLSLRQGRGLLRNTYIDRHTRTRTHTHARCEMPLPEI